MSVSFSIADSSEGSRTFVLWVRGPLDANAARTVVRRLAQADRNHRTAVVLDLNNVSSVEPAGLRALAEVTRSVTGLSRVKVVAPPPEVVEMFRQAALDEVVELVPGRKGEDRRKREIPVKFDRRTGGDRRALTPEPSLP
jgi:anti-anti-sigma factor